MTRPDARASVRGAARGKVGVDAKSGKLPEGPETADARRANLRVRMTYARAGCELRATADPFDRAHDQRRHVDGMLVPAAVLVTREWGEECEARAVLKVQHSRPRLYPEAYCVEVREDAGTRAHGVRVVSVETVYDETERRRRWLLRVGLAVGGSKRAERGGFDDLLMRAVGK